MSSSATRAPFAPGEDSGIGLAVALATLAGLVVAVGLIGDCIGLELGTPLPPFFATWHPELTAGSLAWVALAAGAVGLAVPLARGSGSVPAFLLAATLLGLAARLGVAGADGGSHAFSSVFGVDPEAANEYLPALPGLASLGVGDFVDRFAELAPSLPIHPSGHPPGLLLLLDGLGVTSAQQLATVVIAAGTLSIPLTFFLARRLGHDESRARAAALLVAFSPAAMLYGVSSADALFLTFGLLAVVLLLGSGFLSRLAGALALALASFFSWALLATGTFAVIAIAIREGLRPAALTAALCIAVLASFYLLLALVWGYDASAVLRSASEAYGLGISNARPYVFWLFGSPVAFFVALGLPISWYAARALGSHAPVALALAAIVIVSSVAGFSKAETERIWLFMAPLACVAAAAVIPRERVRLALWLLLAQAIAVELALETVW